MACICQGCNEPYEIDMLIQDELWVKITPKSGDAGLLCPLCICRRLIKLGMTAVRCTIDTDEIMTEDTSWFFTEEWQAKEREADEDFKNGRYTEFDTVEELIEFLHREWARKNIEEK